jgi:hypothetical protein
MPTLDFTEATNWDSGRNSFYADDGYTIDLILKMQMATLTLNLGTSGVYQWIPIQKNNHFR